MMQNRNNAIIKANSVTLCGRTQWFSVVKKQIGKNWQKLYDERSSDLVELTEAHMKVSDFYSGDNKNIKM